MGTIWAQSANYGGLSEIVNDTNLLKEKMPEDGVEPSRGCPHWILNPARLPIPPLRLSYNIDLKD